MVITSTLGQTYLQLSWLNVKMSSYVVWQTPECVLLSLSPTPIHHFSLSQLGQLITFSCLLMHKKKTSLLPTVWTDFTDHHRLFLHNAFCAFSALDLSSLCLLLPLVFKTDCLLQKALSFYSFFEATRQVAPDLFPLSPLEMIWFLLMYTFIAHF